jgi:hypothetical protein
MIRGRYPAYLRVIQNMRSSKVRLKKIGPIAELNRNEAKCGYSNCICPLRRAVAVPMRVRDGN